jgi:hypothetical protein
LQSSAVQKSYVTAGVLMSRHHCSSYNAAITALAIIALCTVTMPPEDITADTNRASCCLTSTICN